MNISIRSPHEGEHKVYSKSSLKIVPRKRVSKPFSTNPIPHMNKLMEETKRNNIDLPSDKVQ